MIGHKNNKTKGTNNAPIPEDNEQYCFRMPLKLEVHKRYWTTHGSASLTAELLKPSVEKRNKTKATFTLAIEPCL